MRLFDIEGLGFWVEKNDVRRQTKLMIELQWLSNNHALNQYSTASS